MNKVFLLGPVEVVTKNKESASRFLSGPKRLALLAYLLLAKPEGFRRRDSLLPLLWPDFDQKSARNALSNMLYHIRKTFGKESILNRGAEEISINRKVFWSDTLEFQQFVKDHHYKKAIDLYREDFLKGFHITNCSPDFEKWLENERKIFLAETIQCARLLSKEAAEKNDINSKIKWLKRGVQLQPYNEEAQYDLIEALLKNSKTREALQFLNQYENHLLSEHDKLPPHFTKLQEKIHNARSSSSTLKRLAVIPLKLHNRSSNNFLCNAIYNDIHNSVSQIAQLDVISKTSVQKLDDQGIPYLKIAEKLEVSYILNGEYQNIEENIHLSVSLIDVNENQKIWVGEFKESLNTKNLFSINKEIAKQVEKVLDKGSNTIKANISKNHFTKNIQAYCIHAEGRWYLDQRTEEGMTNSLKYFREAIELDPEYPLAWVGLADALILLYDYGYGNHVEILNEAKNAVKTAISLAPEMAESNCSLALWFGTQKNGPAAIKQLQRAIQLKPNYAEAHNWLAWIYEVTGKPEEALFCAKRAVELNPLSLEALSNLSISWLINGHYKKSINLARKLQKMQPDWGTGYLLEGIGLYNAGNFKEAFSCLESLKIDWSGELTNYLLISCYLKMGRKQEATTLREKTDDFGKALFYAATRKVNRSLSYFEKIENWDYGKLISIYHLFPEELEKIRMHPEYYYIRQKADRSWNFKSTDNISTLSQGKIYIN